MFLLLLVIFVADGNVHNATVSAHSLACVLCQFVEHIKIVARQPYAIAAVLKVERIAETTFTYAISLDRLPSPCMMAGRAHRLVVRMANLFDLGCDSLQFLMGLVVDGGKMQSRLPSLNNAGHLL